MDGSLLRIVSALAALAWLTSMASAEAQDTEDYVVLRATVTDSGGKHLPNLTQADFTVFEDNVEQKVAFVRRVAPGPIALTLLLDSSNSLGRKFDKVQSLALSFLTRLKPPDVAQVISFSTQVKRLQGFTNDRSQLERAIERVRPDGATALNSAIVKTLNELKKLPAGVSQDAPRHIVVVISDGDDTSSLVPFTRVIELARRSEATFYAVHTAVDSRAVAQSELPQLARETGGRSLLAERADVQTISETLFGDLENQYMIGYASTNSRRDGKWRRVVVEVKVPNAAVRMRPGYFSSQTSVGKATAAERRR